MLVEMATALETEPLCLSCIDMVLGETTLKMKEETITAIPYVLFIRAMPF